MAAQVTTSDIKTSISIASDGYHVAVTTPQGEAVGVNINGSFPMPFPVPGPAGNEIEIVAQEQLYAFDVATTDGRRATTDNATHNNNIAGVVTSNIAPNASGVVIAFGEITNPAWAWQKGDRICLNGYVLSLAPPFSGFVVQIGTALDANRVLVNIQPSFLL